MNVDQAVAEYAARAHHYELLASEAARLIDRVCRSQEGIRLHAVEHRAKSIDSFREKLGREGKAYDDPFADLDDLAGVRIIVYDLGDIRQVESVVSDLLVVDEERSTRLGQRLAANEFGYESSHLICSVPEARRDLREWRPVRDLRCEIQVRTVLQHAWASVSHAYQYKREEDVPLPLRRRLYRIAGLLELADEELSGVRQEHVRLSDAAAETAALDPAVDITSVTYVLTTSPIVQRLYAAALAAGFQPPEFDDDDSTPRVAAQTVALATRARISSVAELLSIADVPDQEIKAYYRRLLDESGTPWGLGPAFAFLLALLSQVGDRLTVDDLVEAGGWAESIARRVLKVATQRPTA